jgi:hypothetical protein
MPTIEHIYTTAVYDNLKMYATWEPTRPVELGTYGELRGRRFIPVGRVSDAGLLKPVVNPGESRRSFTANKTAAFQFRAKGEGPVGGVPAARAALQIDFATKDDVFFNAAGCTYHSVADKRALGVKVAEWYGKGRWERRWAVVTDLIKAQATTVLITGGGNSSIVLEAAAEVPKIDLADAALKLTATTSKGVGYEVVTSAGLTPLLELCKLHWWDGQFRPTAAGLTEAGADGPAPPDAARVYFGKVK